MSHDVFISYASNDRAAAEEVCAALEARGLRCWIAPRNVLPGEDWGMAILAAIAAARCMVLVHSGTTGNSIHVRNEVVTATSHRQPIVPVRVDAAPPSGALRLHLAAWHWLNAYPPPVAAHGDSLAAGVRASFVDADATVNLNLRRPLPPAAAPMADAVAPPPVLPAIPPMPPAPATGRRGSPLALYVIGGSMLVIASVAAWFLTLGPGRDWLPIGAAAEPPRIQIASAGGPGGPGPVLPVAAEPTPAPGGPGVAPTPSPEAPTGPGGSGPPVVREPGPVAGTQPPQSQPQPQPQPQPQQQQAQPQRPSSQPLDVVDPRPQAQPSRPVMVTMHNAGQQDIEQLFVSPITETSWGVDWLGMAQITPGNRVLVPRPPEAGCLFDLRVVWRDRTVEELRRHDLCVNTDLRWDGSKARATGAPR